MSHMFLLMSRNKRLTLKYSEACIFFFMFMICKKFPFLFVVFFHLYKFFLSLFPSFLRFPSLFVSPSLLSVSTYVRLSPLAAVRADADLRFGPNPDPPAGVDGPSANLLLISRRDEAIAPFSLHIAFDE